LVVGDGLLRIGRIDLGCPGDERETLVARNRYARRWADNAGRGWDLGDDLGWRRAEIDDRDRIRRRIRRHRIYAGGFAGTAFTPSMRTAFPSLAESASSPLAPDDSDINTASESAPTPPIWRCMRTSFRCADRYGLANAPRTRPHCGHLSKQTGENLPCPVQVRRITVAISARRRPAPAPP